MKVAALTSGLNVPSARFRLRQHFPFLAARGHAVTEYRPAVDQGARLPGVLGSVRLRYLPPVALGKLLLDAVLRVPGLIGTYRSDVTWLERNFVVALNELGALLKGPLVIDIDDAIWLDFLNRKSLANLLGRADLVLAGNGFLADWCSTYCRNVTVVPTAVDTNRWGPSEETVETDAFTIGWTGTSGNFRYLKQIEASLATFIASHPGARLVVIADRAPDLALPRGTVEFVPWTPDVEAAAMRRFDVGIMPLEDSDWVRGKCSFKMLQYMASGVPVVASPYGMNAELFALAEVGIPASGADEWTAAFEAYAASSALRRAHGDAGRRIAVDRFSTEVVGRQIEAALLQSAEASST